MYKFTREDTGEIVEVDFETMMTQDAAGYIKLPDGVAARRVLDVHRPRAPVEKGNSNHRPPVSDAMGFTAWQLAEFEDDRKKHGFTGVEFKPDPMCPDFYQVHCGSMSEYDAYVAHRGMFQQGRSKGAVLSKKDLADAADLAKRIF
jgi:hypothetical protein